MKIRISKQWAHAVGINEEEREFEVVEQDHNLIGARGFDSFFVVLRDGCRWTVAAARVEAVLP